MVSNSSNLHFLLATFPAQGHINPALQFAKRLMATGAQVTFTTSVFAQRRMLNNSSNFPDGLTMASFSDGYDDGFKPSDSVTNFVSEFKQRGSENLTKVILDLANGARPVTCVIYTLLLPWAADVARELNIPSYLLWIQPAMVFDIYHYYFDGYGDVITGSDTANLIELPGLPPLTCRDIPSFFLTSSPSDPYAIVLEMFHQQFQLLERERGKEKAPLKVLVNTFDALESEALAAVDKYNLIAIGPLVPSAFLDSKHPSHTSFRGDLYKGSKDNYMEWLNSKEESSVVYVSFGTIAVVAKKQMEELARALVDSGRPFLWVIRTSDLEQDKEKEEMVRELVREQKDQGLIVPWCSQVEVLSHPSVGCFLSHCGWNSTLESLVSGVPVVAFPQWTDQGTNAKLIEDISRTGVRVKVNEVDNIVESEELQRCLEIVMGEEGKAKEVRMNAKKWKDLARKAIEEGGSSDMNLRSFVEDVTKLLDCPSIVL